jgi:hypothetical protein
MKCRDVAFRISSEELERASWPTRVLTRLHLLYCRRCRQYAAQMARLGTLARETLCAGSGDVARLQALQARIMDEGFGRDREGEASEPDDQGGRVT